MDGDGRGTWMEKMRLRLVVSPGTEMMSQFVPWFFGAAFPFCFKFGTGMPDMPEWSATSRHRRGAEAPRVELPLWTRIMTRRVESQLRRDWRFGFTMSSLLYQSALNTSRSMRLFADHEQVEDQGDRDFAYMEEAAVSIVEALRGRYEEPGTGNVRAVNGDVNKLKFVASLSDTAQRMVRGAQGIN